MQNEEILSRDLLMIEAVTLRPDEPFTWSSGIRSPIYCDNRLTLSYPDVRTRVAEGLAELIRVRYPEATIIAGTATAGIAHAAIAADKLGLPMCYVRGSSKSHGKGNQIEGRVAPEDRVVIVEDLISTGKSMITVQQALLEAGAEVLGAAAIFTYELEEAGRQLKEAQLPSETLTNYSALIRIAAEEGYVREKDMERLQEWKQDPVSWS
ncbi:orotate phosphoribosyltransferase [Marinococcus halophilus]|uniref:Orotate phosphoribosyltransferase n=1 Tax=Marinococcus halophilus TaxID=1371 RepID=A0A510Y1Z5_MARHA|nr:orotate phosphoribosyltransferase [Marinococcus halophilus]OZT81385.1 orotate phosphoribosyltransferase [Marinococcus halophilus]GEK57338.1 orotate phosphoribosyltransferase [Marinococcus halophilus]